MSIRIYNNNNGQKREEKNIHLYCFFLLLSLFACNFGSHAADSGCPDGSIIFREDFGGNNTEDPASRGSAIPECEGYNYDDNVVDYAKIGKYSIRKVAFSGHTAWYSNISDHTISGDPTKGYFMQIDASGFPCQFYETTLHNICEGAELYFSLYGTSSTSRYGDSNATLRLIVEDAATGTEIDHHDIEIENQKNGEWEQFGFSVTIPAGCNSVKYRIINNAVQPADPDDFSGNDFCLDDIEIHSCVPQPTITAEKGSPLCRGVEETLTANISNADHLTPPLVYTWFKCATNSYNINDWVKIYSGQTLSMPHVTPEDAGFYKVMVTGFGQSSAPNICNSLSEFYEIVVTDCGTLGIESCPNGTILFKEDFGGNKTSDPDIKTEPIPQCSYAFGEDPRDSEGKGKYSIRKVGVNQNVWYQHIYDHTYPDDSDKGYFMQVDGSSTSGIFYQTEISGLCENSELFLSMWGMSSTRVTGALQKNANLKLIVEDLDGNTLASSNIEIINHKGFWEQFGLKYIVPAGQTAVVYKIVNNSADKYGNDFCLDDIEVRLCNPPVTVESPDSLCPGSDYTLTADFKNDGTYAEPVTLTWFKSDTASYEPSDWTAVGSGTTLELTNIGPSEEGYYRVWVSGDGASELISKCNSASDFAEIRIKDCSVCEDTTISLADTILLGSAYQKNGFDISNPTLGDNQDTLHLKRKGDCDSTVALNLFVYYNSSDTIRTSICQGEQYIDFGFDESSTGEYTHSFTNIYGGDSLVTLDLKVLPLFNDTIQVSILEGDKYTFGGKDYTDEGTFTDSLKSAAGCDSVMTLQLTVLKGSSDTIHASICQGERFTNFGFDESSAGEYTQTLTASNGSDSLVTLVLEVLPTYNDTVKASILEGDNYTFGGKDYTDEGTFTDSLKSTAGCDSVMTLQLTVLKGSSDTIHASICQGERFSNFGFDESSTGEYTQSLTASNGSDSLVTLVLEVLPIFNDTVKVSILEGDNYTFGGKDYTDEGTFTDSLKSTAGCDSVMTLQLTVLKGSSDTIHASICQGERFTNFGFDESSTGEYTQSLTASNGSDSLVTLVLEVLPIFNDTVKASILEGDNYRFGGKDYTDEGTFTDSLKSAAGCDSVMTLQLTVIKGSSDTIHASICQGERFTNFGFDEASAGEHTQTLTASNGSDSLVTLVLVVLPTYSDTTKASILEGNKYTFGGKDYTDEGTFTDSLKTVAGCDSVMTLQLTVIKGTSDTIRASICQGERFTNFGFDEASAGEHTQTLTASNGSDSLVTLVLKVLPTYSDTTKASILEGDKYTFGGKDYTTQGTFTDSLKTVAGCDSVMTLQLTVIKGTSDTIRASICQGERFTNFGFDEATAGEHTQTLTASNGSDSLVTLVLEVLPTYNDTIEAKICPGESYDQHGFDESHGGTYHLDLKSINGCDSTITLILTELASYEDTLSDTICEGETYEKNGFNLQNEATGLSSHTLNFSPVSGCDSVVTLNLNVLPLHAATQEFLIKQGDVARLNGKRYKEEGEYHQYSQTSEFCEDITIIVKFKEDTVSVDTFNFITIIPDEYLIRGDGTDRRWHVENIELYPKATVSIYDRWGKKLFEIMDYNDETGWDGTYNGHDMPSTDYWYQIEVREIDRFFTGHFTLIR